jgi:glycosyltransferase involved in cell wall biosynthesis
MKPLVSILIPAYNAQEWIGETLRSALDQTWERKEIIVVNDGSTDDTIAVARQFKSSCMKLVNQRNAGASAARNAAFSLSQGDFIQWLDADDILAPDKVASQMQAFERLRDRRTLFSGGWARFMYRHRRAKFVPSALWADLSPVDWLITKMGQNLYMQTASWLVSRELTEAAGPWDTRLLGDDDGEYFCRVLLASSGVKFVPESKVYYRASGASSLSYIGVSDRKRDAQWISMQLHIHYIRSLEDSERVRAACERYLQTWMVYFYPERKDLFRQAEQLARDLGGELHIPPLSWKYNWINALFGSYAAKRAQITLPRLRWSAACAWDRLLFRITHQSSPASQSRTSG